MTKLDSDAIFDAPARRMLNQCRQACSTRLPPAGCTGTIGRLDARDDRSSLHEFRAPGGG